jgi:hypothetical protein
MRMWRTAPGTAPYARTEAAATLLDNWRTSGSSRIDRELDGKLEILGPAAIMDAAWPRLADAVMEPVLGPLVDRLAALHGRSDDPATGGSAYVSGWCGYVDKDLRTLLGRPLRGPYSRRYCGAGVLATCRQALWAALDAAAAELEAKQGAGAFGLARRCDSRAHPIHVGRARGHDALVEPADLPAAHVLYFPSSALDTLGA